MESLAGTVFYLIDAGIHERLLEPLARPRLALRTMALPRASTLPAGSESIITVRLKPGRCVQLEG